MVAIVQLRALLGIFILTGCSYNLDTSQLEADIQADIERQGRRLILKDVICPQRVAKQAEAYTRCVGELPDGGQFTINVIQQDDQGTVTWNVPSSKVLINLVSLEETIQAGMNDAVGKRLAVDCRDTYRVNKRGDSFECDVVGAGIVAAGRVESVLVKVDSKNNLEWQEIIVATTPATAQETTAASTTNNAESASQTDTDSAPKAEEEDNDKGDRQ